MLDPSSAQPSPSLRTRLWILDSILFGVAAASVGLFSATSVWLFKRTIDLVHAGATDCSGRGSVNVPHGGTRLQAGDILVVAADDDKVWGAIKTVCGKPD